VQGYYNRDHEYYHEYHRATRTVEGNAEWMGQWVADVKDRAGYFQKLGEERRQGLQLKEHRYAAPVDYGY
jgi:glutaconate CoA-transferase subunit A